MKKVVMMLAAAMCVAVVHGASLSWAVSAVTTPADPSQPGVGYSVYLFATSVSGALTYTTTTTDAVVKSINDGTFAGGIVKGKLSNAGGISGDVGLGNGFTTGDAMTAFAVIFDGDYDAKNGGNYIITAEKSTSWGAPTGSKIMAFGSQSKATWTAYGTTPTPPGPTPGDVPEPTSGLLLAIGGAALALRRKQK